jgi:PDZ domain
MRIRRLIFSGLVSFAFVLGARAVTMAQDQSGSPSVSAQPGATSPAPGIRSQPESDRTLELAPQTGTRPPEGKVKVIPGDRAYNPGENSALIDRNYNPDETGAEMKGEHKLPYLGITVQWASKCFLGKEEHGLEIFSVDPNSPASQAGLRANREGSAKTTAALAGAVLGPIGALLDPWLERGIEEKSGDLIVAVDDHRVRSRLDLEDELAKLKPGDKMYITVLRPLPGGGHRELRIAVKVGHPGDAFASAGSSPPAQSDSDAEQYAY